MCQNQLEILSKLSSVVNKLKDETISQDYWEKEESLIKIKIDESKKEANSIKMSSQKFHKAFSL